MFTKFTSLPSNVQVAVARVQVGRRERREDSAEEVTRLDNLGIRSGFSGRRQRI